MLKRFIFALVKNSAITNLKSFDMLRFIFFTIFSTLLVEGSWAQTAFQKTYHRAWDNGTALEILSNGDLLLGGNSNDPLENELPRLLLQKVSENGTTIWAKLVDNTDNLFFTDFQLLQGDDILATFIHHDDTGASPDYAGYCRITAEAAQQEDFLHRMQPIFRLWISCKMRIPKPLG